MDFKNIFPNANHEQIETLEQERAQWLQRPSATAFRTALDAVATIHSDDHDFTGDVIRIGKPQELQPAQQERLRQTLQALVPWRKGPFDLFGIGLDSEWRSHRKWDRLLPRLPFLGNKRIADLGCNNGYYMLRMLPHNPQLVVGFDPTVRYYYQFQLLRRLSGIDRVRYSLLGVEHLSLFPQCFDVVFLLGVLYHHPEPITMLRNVLSALQPGGWLLLESQGIPGELPVALLPARRYGKVPGTWYVPTATCVENMLQRSGFREIDVFCVHPMSSEEQRRTQWMPYESYSDFIDPRRPQLTVEGYPAPLRILVRARKQEK